MSEVRRVELKYRIHTLEKAKILAQIKHVLKMDIHGSSKGYVVKSLYFDTMDDQDYWDKVNGIEKRKKIRIRTYGNTGIYKLELKQKNGMFQRKYSINITTEEVKELQSCNFTCLLQKEEPIARTLYLILTEGCYRPKVLVQYQRLAFFSLDNETRITFDEHLEASESQLDILHKNTVLYPVYSNTYLTLEVKYNHYLFSPIKHAIGPYLSSAISISKYCLARSISKHNVGV